jgi:hypothetical protein
VAVAGGLVDPTSTVLEDKYDEIMAEFDVPDPQKVPESILGRTTAVRAEDLLGAAFWKPLVHARNRGTKRAKGWEQLSRAVDRLNGESA